MAEAEAASTWRHVRYLLQISFKESETEQIFTIVISNQFKTGFRMRLTSSVKELEAILQKLINLDKIQNENETKRWFVGDADALGPGVFGFGLGATTETNLFSQELDK